MTRCLRTRRCPDRVLGWIPWIVDGELSDREKMSVEAHAAHCRRCRGELGIVHGEPLDEKLIFPDSERLYEKIVSRIELRRRVREYRGSRFESVGFRNAGRMG